VRVSTRVMSVSLCTVEGKDETERAEMGQRGGDGIREGNHFCGNSRFVVTLSPVDLITLLYTIY
jgi:hypothetical protein